MKTYLFIIAFSLLTFVSCKKKETAQYTDTPIIESYLQTGSPFNVKVTRQIPFINDAKTSDDDINNLTMSVNYNGTDYPLSPAGNGKYVNNSLTVTDGAQFNLAFNFNSKKVTAYTYVPSKPQNYTQSVTTLTITKVDLSSGPPSGGIPTIPDPVQLTWTNNDASNYLLVIENMETNPEGTVDFGSNTPPNLTFRKSPTKASGIEIRAMEFNYFGMHRLILYHVLPDYASLYDASSTSSQNLSNPSTSIVNGYGIFTGLNSDTLFINVKKK